MSPSRIHEAGVAVALAAVLCGDVHAATKSAPDVAVVSSLSGSVTVVAPPSSRPQVLSAFDWLTARSLVTVNAGSRLTLAFVDGRRCEIEGAATVVVTATGPRLRSGTLRSLPPVPPFPRFPVLAREGAPGVRSGAVRIRVGLDTPIRGVYPRAGARSVAAATVLQFDPVAGMTDSYHVEIEDESGATVFEADTRSPSLPVPDAALRAGARYFWRVQATDRVGATSSGAGEVVTLHADDVRRRSALHRALEERPEPELRLLLAEIDWRLGLWREARDGFQAALATSPDPVAVQARLSRIEERLGDERGPQGR